MTKAFCEKIFSAPRMRKYYEACPGDNIKAVELYKQNIMLSAAFYPLLTVVEVALRNALEQQLIQHFRSENWHSMLHTTAGLSELNKEITKARQYIQERGEQISGPKLTAELTLGFWVRLLNRKYEMILWKSLRRAFPLLPKQDRQRHKVSAPLNKIRNYRNRIFHHEPICWDMQEVKKMHDEIYSVIGWIDKDLPYFVRPMDRVAEAMIFESGKS